MEHPLHVATPSCISCTECRAPSAAACSCLTATTSQPPWYIAALHNQRAPHTAHTLYRDAHLAQARMTCSLAPTIAHYGSNEHSSQGGKTGREPDAVVQSDEQPTCRSSWGEAGCCSDASNMACSNYNCRPADTSARTAYGTGTGCRPPGRVRANGGHQLKQCEAPSRAHPGGSLFSWGHASVRRQVERCEKQAQGLTTGTVLSTGCQRQAAPLHGRYLALLWCVFWLGLALHPPEVAWQQFSGKPEVRQCLPASRHSGLGWELQFGSTGWQGFSFLQRSGVCVRRKACRQHASRVQSELMLPAWGFPGALGATFPSDKQALLEFYGSLQSKGDLQGVWSNSSDPCDDNWLGVLCDEEVCSSGFLPDCWNSTPWDRSVALPTPAAASRIGYSSVTGLMYTDLGSVVGADFVGNRSKALIGPLSPALARLQELRLLNLAGNLLSGSIPPELGQLPRLEQLLLSSNTLRGPIPGTLGFTSTLSLLDISNNILNGSLSPDFCQDSFRASISLSGNLGLCGYVPPCIAPRTLGILNTALISPAASRNSLLYDQVDACCNAVQPSCVVENNCGVAVPRFWTNASQAEFAFTPFSAPEGAIGELEYYWTWSTSDKGPNQQAPQDGVFRRLNLSEADTGPVNHISSTNYFWWSNGTGPPVPTPSNLTFYKFQLEFLDSIVLTEGVSYFIFVFGVNSSCPNARAPAVSAAATVVVTGPRGGEVIVNNNLGTQSQMDSITFMYHNFTDTFLPSSSMRYQYVLSTVDDGTGVGTAVLRGPEDITGKADTPILIDNLQLQTRIKYQVVVSATNLAGRVGNASGSVLVTGSSSSSIQLALGLSLGLAALFALVTTLGVWLFLRRQRQQEQLLQRERTQLKSLRSLVNGMSSSHFVKLEELDDAMASCPALCFVVTDLENSTGMAAANKQAYNELLQLHDMIMRQYINKHNGYEISTEGDSFNIAFLEVAQAVQFCMDVQHTLTETNWPPNVLQLPTCKPVHDVHGELLFNGPRVRMGVHFAPAVTLFPRKHAHTQHWEFGGPGFQLAKSLGDAAAGGQVLMTDTAWLELTQIGMDKAGFPIVYQLGRFVLPGAAQPSFLYEVQGQLGRSLGRTFADNPRQLTKVGDGLGYDLGIPPVPPSVVVGNQLDGTPRKAGDELAFVACRLVPPVRDAMVPEVVHQQIRNMLDTCAQQYEGYMFHEHIDVWVSGTACRWYYAFSDVLHALRFAHVGQMYLMTERWETGEHNNTLWGPEEKTPDGRLLYRGPRIAMAITYTEGYSEEEMPSSCPQYRAPDVKYVGEGVRVLSLLVCALHGGQVVLDQAAWGAVHEVLPLQAQVIDLGVFQWPPDNPTSNEKMQLMEVMPSMLNYRTFGPLSLLEQLEPGYRESPDPHHNMVIMFVKVSKPHAVTEAQAGIKGHPPNSDLKPPHETGDAVMEVDADSHANLDATRQRHYNTLKAWNIAVSGLHCVVRDLQPEFNAYECKEPEKGKFTIAFRDLRQALSYSSALHIEMVRYNWPSEVLQLEDCQPERDSQGRLLWRGPRVKVGMAYGQPTLRKVLNTGRADYFGALPNLAARVMTLAKPGQSLLDISKAVIAEMDEFVVQGAAAQDGSFTELGHLLDGAMPPLKREHSDYLYHIKIWGKYGHPELKGVPDQRLIGMLEPVALAERHFDKPKPHKPRLEKKAQPLQRPSTSSALRNLLQTTPYDLIPKGSPLHVDGEEVIDTANLDGHKGCIDVVQMLQYRRLRREARLLRERRRNRNKAQRSSYSKALFRRTSAPEGSAEADNSDDTDDRGGPAGASSHQRTDSSIMMHMEDELLAATAAAEAADAADADLSGVPPGHLLRVPLARISALASLRRPSQQPHAAPQGRSSDTSPAASDVETPFLTAATANGPLVAPAGRVMPMSIMSRVPDGHDDLPGGGRAGTGGRDDAAAGAGAGGVVSVTVHKPGSASSSNGSIHQHSSSAAKGADAPLQVGASAPFGSAQSVEVSQGSHTATVRGSASSDQVISHLQQQNGYGSAGTTAQHTVVNLEPLLGGQAAEAPVTADESTVHQNGALSNRVHRVPTQPPPQSTTPDALGNAMNDLHAAGKRHASGTHASTVAPPVAKSTVKSVANEIQEVSSDNSIQSAVGTVATGSLPTPFATVSSSLAAVINSGDAVNEPIRDPLDALSQPTSSTDAVAASLDPLATRSMANEAQSGRCTRVWYGERPAGLGVIDEPLTASSAARRNMNEAQGNLGSAQAFVSSLRKNGKRVSWDGSKKGSPARKGARAEIRDPSRSQSVAVGALAALTGVMSGSLSSRKACSNPDSPPDQLGSFTSANGFDANSDVMRSPVYAKESYEPFTVAPLEAYAAQLEQPIRRRDPRASEGGSTLLEPLPQSSPRSQRSIRISDPDENAIRNAVLEARVTIQAQRHMQTAMPSRRNSKTNLPGPRRATSMKSNTSGGSVAGVADLRVASSPRIPLDRQQGWRAPVASPDSAGSSDRVGGQSDSHAGVQTAGRLDSEFSQQLDGRSDSHSSERLAGRMTSQSSSLH